jgi:hypothetical protein
MPWKDLDIVNVRTEFVLKSLSEPFGDQDGASGNVGQ